MTYIMVFSIAPANHRLEASAPSWVFGLAVHSGLVSHLRFQTIYSLPIT